MDSGHQTITIGVPQAFQLAVSHQSAGRLAEAEQLYRQILIVEPNHPGVLNNLGNILTGLKRHAEAEPLYRQALAVMADHPEIFSNLGNALNELGRHEEAERCCRRALMIKPDHSAAHFNLGNALRALGRPGEAERSFREALALNPDSAELRQNLGIVLYQLGRLDEAMQCLMQAQAIDPGNAVAHGYEGMIRLLAGDFSAGWKKYEWRWKAPNSGLPSRDFAQPLWHGTEDLNGKVILLHAEQALGDTIQFSRYVPLIAARGATVVLEVPKVLVPLMAGLRGTARVIAAGDPLPAADFHSPLLSLPLAFATTLQSIPASIPYLSVDAKAVLARRKQLAGNGEKLVGVCWKGDPRNNTDRMRSISVTGFAPLLSAPGVRFVSLHKELGEQERALTANLPNFTHPGADFASTAEIVAALDLVITVDTAWAHWAGAIGKPVWVMLPFVPDWRWLVDREDSPWYPTARLFRQARLGDWESAIQKVNGELGRWLALSTS